MAVKEASAGRPSARERLLAAANELFYDEGVHTVGIDRIIEQAGVAKASLYNTFGSKDELVRAYLQTRHDSVTQRITAAASSRSRADPRAALAWLTAMVLATFLDRLVYRMPGAGAAAGLAARPGRFFSRPIRASAASAITAAP